MNTTQFFNIIWLESRAEFLKTVRVPAFAIPSLLFPMMFYVFFALIFNQSTGHQAPAYLMATYGAFGVIGPALFSFGVGVAIEKDQGWLALKQSSPMPIAGYFVARVNSSLLFGFVIVLSLFVLGAVFGGVAMSKSQWIMTLLVLLFGSLPFATLGLWLGLSLSGQAAPAIVNLIYLPMAFLSGLWIPIFMFPEILQQFAWMLPAFHLAQLTLAVQGLSEGHRIGIHIMAILVMTSIFSLLAFRSFRRQAQR